jgi:hypothetical protein
MAKGMWLEHPEGQEDAVRHANALRDIARAMPDGAAREAVDDAAAFLGAIADPDCPPMTTEEVDAALARRAANPDEAARREARMRAFAAAVRARTDAAE